MLYVSDHEISESVARFSENYTSAFAKNEIAFRLRQLQINELKEDDLLTLAESRPEIDQAEPLARRR